MTPEFTPYEAQFYQRDEVAGGVGQLTVANTTETVYQTNAAKPYDKLSVEELEHPDPDETLQRGYN